ncbi:hypothetical protein KAW44_08200, partial [Candidatus Bipolaricaulota bacterium]|nr:hypothetical protein [Candidatus Bipolaricaulota bacterium]
LDLAVISPVKDMTDLPREEGGSPLNGTPSIWPAIYEQLLTLINSHRSTLIFANNRRSVERIAAELNKRAGYTLVQAHHGSVSKERRGEIEQNLKAGRLPALVATGSLELGIDMGAIDLVCQVESPHSVARGLQRVGRAGHLYRAASVGRLVPKTREDLLEMAALARAMRRGEISAVHIPRGPLDVLAQQVVAMVAVEEREVDFLYNLIHQAAPLPLPHQGCVPLRARHARRWVSDSGLSRSAAADLMGPRERPPLPASGKQTLGDHQRRSDPRYRPVPGRPGRGRDSPGGTRRGVHLRTSRRGDDPPGDRTVADHANRSRPRACHPLRGEGSADTVLAWGGARA